MARISSQPLRGFRSGSADERKKRESSEKSVQAAKTVPSPRAVFRTSFSFRCLHYLGAWNMLNFGSHLSGRSDHRAQTLAVVKLLQVIPQVAFVLYCRI